MISLGVVVITKNQDWNIERLLRSVLNQSSVISAQDIIVVDSASADETVERARSFDVRVVQLSAAQRLTPAAGRYVGFHLTTGDAVLFLDGDMELCDGWLEPALRTLDSLPDVAVITGHVVDVDGESSFRETPSTESAPASNEVIAIRQPGGAALYRRSVLEEVGTFNPYLYSDGEPELCLRVRHAGYRVVRIPRRLAFHYVRDGNQFATVLARRRRNLYLGYGQVFRYHLRDGLLWWHLRERGWWVGPGLALLVGLGSVGYSLYAKTWIPTGIWAASGAVICIADAVRKRSCARTVHSLLRRLVILEGFLRGLLLRPLDPRTYPIHVEPGSLHGADVTPSALPSDIPVDGEPELATRSVN